MAQPRVQIKTKLSNGNELIADVSDGIAIFTSNDPIMLKQLFEIEKKKEKMAHIPVTISKWVDGTSPAITKVYIDKSKEEIVAELKAEMDKAMAKPKKKNKYTFDEKDRLVKVKK